MFAFGLEGEFPRVLSRLHPRFHTPVVAILSYAAMVWLLAVSGGFLWLAKLTAAASMIMYISICAALIRLRRLEPDANAVRVPFGPVLSVIGIVISLVLIARLQLGQMSLMGLTVLLAAANWWLTVGGKDAPRRA
jgi:amino acid transporter